MNTKSFSKSIYRFFVAIVLFSIFAPAGVAGEREPHNPYTVYGLRLRSHLLPETPGAVDELGPLVFQELIPCRFVSTLEADLFEQPWGGKAFTAHESRTYFPKGQLVASSGWKNPCNERVPQEAVAVALRLSSYQAPRAGNVYLAPASYGSLGQPALGFTGGKDELREANVVLRNHGFAMTTDEATDLTIDIIGYFLRDPLGVGAQGEKGDRGDKGDRGEPGAQGHQGLTGETGSQGLPGEHGDKGDRGDTGSQGQQGLKGDTGTQGLQGERGLQGEKGDRGEAGAQGLQGHKGDTGSQGLQGERGLQGGKGDRGETGAQGLQGHKGDTGSQGLQGERGLQGGKGERGEIGPQGPKGDTGLKGDKGDNGAPGDKGYKGDKGDKGDSVSGPKGDKGDKGSNGDRGYKGDKGDRGEKGPKGDKGECSCKKDNKDDCEDDLKAEAPAGGVMPARKSGPTIKLGSSMLSIPAAGRLTVEDPAVSASSIILLISSEGTIIPVTVSSQEDGSFVASGVPTGSFKYIVFNAQ